MDTAHLSGGLTGKAEQFVKGYSVIAGDFPRQLQARLLLPGFDARQVAGVGAQFVGNPFQEQAPGESEVFQAFHHRFSIALNAINCQADIAAPAYALGPAGVHHLKMLTPQKIGLAIDRLRQDRRLTKKALAELCDIDPGNLNRIISGQQEATLTRMEALSKGLSVHVSDIYRLAEGGQPPATDPRKAALHVLIEQLDPDQLDAAFRRLPVSPPKREETPALPDSGAK